jgi:hypothetical protein
MRTLLRKQMGTSWNWDKAVINIDPEWWNKVKVKHLITTTLFTC